ncbi:slc44a4 [Symbiodinium sp. CCMP2456]|nr:slc44a4 [Symbiodinium sp. CCMP2456]
MLLCHGCCDCCPLGILCSVLIPNKPADVSRLELHTGHAWFRAVYTTSLCPNQRPIAPSHRGCCPSHVFRTWRRDEPHSPADDHLLGHLQRICDVDLRIGSCKANEELEVVLPCRLRVHAQPGRDPGYVSAAYGVLGGDVPQPGDQHLLRRAGELYLWIRAPCGLWTPRQEFAEALGRVTTGSSEKTCQPPALCPMGPLPALAGMPSLRTLRAPSVIPELNDFGGFIYTYIVMLAAGGVVVLLLVAELTVTLQQLRSKARQTQPVAADQMVKVARAGAESLRCREDRPTGVYTPVWQRGLEHSIIQGFLELAAEGLSESAIKTNEVCQRHVKPLTAPAGCSAWEALGAGWDSLTVDAHRHPRSQHLNTPTVMVSHCWASPFQDVVKIMGRYDENTNKSNFFFFDVFSMNQHDLSDLAGPDRKDQPGQDMYDVMLEALTNSIRTPRRVLLALTPHHEPQLLSRSWCLYEIYMAWKLKAEVSCGFVPAGEQMVIQSLQEGDVLIEHMLSKVDAEKSQATVESDRLMILELIQKDGVSKFNQFVREKLAASLRVVALTTMPSTTSADLLDWAPDMPARTISCDTRSHFARLISLESTVDENAPRLQLSTGRILGEYVGATEHFSSIPFAAPPLGERRWRKPAPVQPWQGELDCSSHRAPDDRRGRPVQWVDPRSTDRLPNEDCLYLDLWLPKGTAERSGKPLLPVLVWIYGGGLLGGSKDDPGSSGQCYAEQGIIYLSINYRVGALGFLCPKGGDANCGLWDQVAALQWVQKEIRSMGGDATRVALMDADGAYSLTHGRDHYGQHCGREPLEAKPFAAFPDLENDFKKDKLLQSRYGVCVEECPKQFQTIPDYEGDLKEGGQALRKEKDSLLWYISLPTTPIAGRCIPYDPPPEFTGAVEFCADPPCLAKDGVPESYREVCGLHKDKTDRFWLLSKEVDDILEDGWKREGADDQVVAARVRLAAQDKTEPCKVKVYRDTRVQTAPVDSSLTYSLLTKYTGQIFVWCKRIYENRWLVLGLGIGGSLVLSMAIIMGFACCVGLVVHVLIALLFAVLICADYVLFRQAGLVTGRTGKMILDMLQKVTEWDMPAELGSLIQDSTQDEQMREVYKWSAVGLLLCILLLACAALAARKNLQILVALLKEASNTMREMPSLLLAPFMLALSMIFMSVVMLWVSLAFATANASDIPRTTEAWHLYIYPALKAAGLAQANEMTQMRQTALVFNLFVFLFIYHFHVSLCIAITAMCVSHWPWEGVAGVSPSPSHFNPGLRVERNAGTGVNSEGWFFGRPILLAFLRLCRHHLGSLVFGSCIMAIATALRLIFEYVAAKTKDQESNPVVRAAVCACRCCLWCLERCLQFITEYAYVYVAVTGKTFCSSAHASFVFFAKYPVQTAMDKMASAALGYLLCVTVPLGLAVVAFPWLSEGSWPPCAIVIIALAYVTTRLAAGIYDVCITTLFVCVMRDCEHYDGRYMSKTLRSACGFGELARQSLAARQSAVDGIELQ